MSRYGFQDNEQEQWWAGYDVQDASYFLDRDADLDRDDYYPAPIRDFQALVEHSTNRVTIPGEVLDSLRRDDPQSTLAAEAGATSRIDQVRSAAEEAARIAELERALLENAPPSTEAVDEHVKQVAALLPFDVDLDADMGGTFTLQIDLGTRGGVDDPPDTAGIDPDGLPAPRWWVDIEGGRRTVISNLGLDSDLAEVAAWVAETARAEGCPAVEASNRSGAAEGEPVASSVNLNQDVPQGTPTADAEGISGTGRMNALRRASFPQPATVAMRTGQPDVPQARHGGPGAGPAVPDLGRG